MRLSYWFHHGLVALLVLSTSTVLLAHQQKLSLTTIKFNQRTSLVEVSQRFSLHDAEHAGAKLFDWPNLPTDRNAQQRFVDVLSNQFSILNEQQQPIELTFVGFETSNRFLWVYHEFPIEQASDCLYVKQRALHDLWPDQLNSVNIERGSGTKTLLFMGNGDEFLNECAAAEARQNRPRNSVNN